MWWLYLNINMYQQGFKTKIKNDYFPKGINKKIIKIISQKRKEPIWMLEIRLKAYKIWKKMKEPHWLNGKYNKIKYKKIKYFSKPQEKSYIKKNIKKTFNKLGVLRKNSNLGVDAIFDSVSIKTTYKKKLYNKYGIIFCSFNEAIQNYPKLVKKYICKVIPINDNFFSTLNTAVLSDGTFIYIPKNTKCPINLSSYFRINANVSQFERTLIILKKNSSLEYIEGCSASIKKYNQLHAGVVEIILSQNSKIKYSTVQNWFPGNPKGGVFNFVTKRALCKGNKSQISWIQLETGSAITWKYPSTILLGNNSKGSFFSISLTKLKQQADTGTKMIHIGKKTKSFILAKSIATDKSINTHRSLVKINRKSKKSKNFTKCSSLMIGNNCCIFTQPYIKSQNKYSYIEHEASTTYIKKEQIFFLMQRGIKKNYALSMIINGFCQNILNKLPPEFILESKTIFNIF